jgi:gliding motility-associated-like protein
MRYLFLPLLFLFLFIFNTKIEAQIVVTPSAGCMPGLTNVSFSYLGPPASSLTWNFGDGSPTSNLVSPQHSYLTVGPKTVVCTAIIGSSPQTFTFLVQVFPLPSGGIVAPAVHPNGCAPRVATLSTVGSNTNYAYSWAFGDNTGGAGSVVTHSYTVPGSYYPTLTITDILTNCSSAYSWTSSAIHVSALPNLFITANPGTFSCTAPFTTAFSAGNSTSGSPISGGGLNYSWNFGNSQTAIGVSPPSVTYGSGQFTVTLTATDNNNCTHSIIQPVSAVMPTLQVTVPPAVCVASQMPTGPAPNNIFGIWTPSFAVTAASSQTTTFWNMGDGSPIKQFPNPNNPAPWPTSLVPNVAFGHSLHAYSTPGLKIGTVSVNAGTCVATQTFAIFVEQITPSFVTAPHVFTCSPTIVANYTNLSVNNSTSALTYTWFVQHWNPLYSTTTTATNPTFTFTQGSANPYTIYDTYKPDVYLFVQSQLGCIAVTNEIFDSIRRPTAFFNKNKKEGCAPLTVVYADSSFTDHNVFPITSYTWNNGASPPVTQTGTLAPAPAANSVIPNYTFTYVNPGVYYPFLEIQTFGGCSSKSFVDTITVVNPPNIAMTLTPNLSVCAGQSLQVNLSSTSTPFPQHVHVESGENYFSGCVSDPNPIWAYHNPGVYGFTVSAYLNSCSATAVPMQTVLVKGPAAAMRYQTNCTNKLNVNFNYALRDVSSATLNFGASPSSTVFLAGSPGNTITGAHTYTYPSAGNFIASITAENANGCGPYTQTMAVTVRQPSAVINFSPVVCKDNFMSFIAQTFTDNVVGCTMGYAWLIDTLPPFATSVNTLMTYFTTVGMHTVTLRVKDQNGCEDRKTETFRVASPALTFTFNHNPICFSQYPPQLINLTPQTPDVVNSFTWMYGPPLNSAPFPAFIQTVTGLGTQTYNFNIGSSPSQTFDIKLIAKDVIGCIDSIRHKIQVNNPEAFIYLTPNACIPTGSANFNFYSQPTYTNYVLNFGSGSYSLSTPNPSASIVFTASGSFNPTLTVTDNAGCITSYSMTSPFQVQTYPVPDFTLQTSTGSLGNEFCIPKGSAVTLSLTSTSSTAFPVYYQWDMGIPPLQPPGTLSTAVRTYTNPGTFNLVLTLYPATAPCIISKSITVNLYGEPSAQAVADKSVFCKGDPIQFSMLNDSSVHHWQWDFGDNQPTPVYTQISPKTVSYNYPPNFFPESTNGNLLVILSFASPNDICKNIDTIRVKMLRVLPQFKRNNELTVSDFAHCLGISDTFSNTTQSNSTFLTYTWSFGDGNTSTAISPNYTYPLPGNYTVNLIAKDFEAGCTDNVSKTMTVFPLPTALLNIDDLACPDSLFLVTGNGAPGLNGAVTGTLSGGNSAYNVIFDAGNSFSLQATAPVTTVFTLQVSDNNSCKSMPVTDSIRIQLPPPAINTSTTIIIGQTVTVNGFLGNGYTYVWVNDTSFLSCTNCYNPVSSSTSNITYTVSVSDLPLKCFEVLNQHTVVVRLVASIDVPSAFTPNYDGINDFILPAGWGIRKLNYFKVFNRWGQLLFESNDLDKGWDGTFNGVPQNMETYIYQASVDTYTDETLTKSGSFKLIR